MNCIKINFDASFVDNVARMGMVARNHEGLVMAAACAYSIHTSSVLLAETLAFRWALSLALDLHFWRHALKQIVCSYLKKGVQGSSYFMSIISNCSDLVSSFISFSFSFVRRSENFVVDGLAKDSSKFSNAVWIEEVPRSLRLWFNL